MNYDLADKHTSKLRIPILPLASCGHRTSYLYSVVFQGHIAATTICASCYCNARNRGFIHHVVSKPHNQY